MFEFASFDESVIAVAESTKLQVALKMFNVLLIALHSIVNDRLFERLETWILFIKQHSVYTGWCTVKCLTKSIIQCYLYFVIEPTTQYISSISNMDRRDFSRPLLCEYYSHKGPVPALKTCIWRFETTYIIFLYNIDTVWKNTYHKAKINCIFKHIFYSRKCKILEWNI